MLLNIIHIYTYRLFVREFRPWEGEISALPLFEEFPLSSFLLFQLAFNHGLIILKMKSKRLYERLGKFWFSIEYRNLICNQDLSAEYIFVCKSGIVLSFVTVSLALIYSFQVEIKLIFRVSK